MQGNMIGVFTKMYCLYTRKAMCKQINQLLRIRFQAGNPRWLTLSNIFELISFSEKAIAHKTDLDAC